MNRGWTVLAAVAAGFAAARLVAYAAEHLVRAQAVWGDDDFLLGPLDLHGVEVANTEIDTLTGRPRPGP